MGYNLARVYLPSLEDSDTQKTNQQVAIETDSAAADRKNTLVSGHTVDGRNPAPPGMYKKPSK